MPEMHNGAMNKSYRAKFNVQLEKLPRSSKTCGKNVYLTVNQEQSLFNCLTILFSITFIRVRKRYGRETEDVQQCRRRASLCRGKRKKTGTGN